MNEKLKGSPLALGKILLRPTRIYVKDILFLKEKITINALSHITGGGLIGNLERIVTDNLSAAISIKKFPFHNELFSLIQEKSNLSHHEMLSTFNCGIGMIISIPKKELSKANKILQKLKIPNIKLGEIVSKKGDDKIYFLNE